MKTYTDAEGEDEGDANLRLHNIVHSSLDVVGERRGIDYAFGSRSTRGLTAINAMYLVSEHPYVPILLPPPAGS